MSKRPDGSRLSSDLSTSDSNECSDAPATLSAASSSQPPRNTDRPRNTRLSSSDSRFHEWLNTALRLACCGEASLAALLRKSRLALIEEAILSGEKWRTQ